MTSEDNALLVTPEEAARRLALGRTTLYSLIASEAIASVRIGRSRRVPVAALDRFVEQLASPASAATLPDDHAVAAG